MATKVNVKEDLEPVEKQVVKKQPVKKLGRPSKKLTPLRKITETSGYYNLSIPKELAKKMNIKKDSIVDASTLKVIIP